MKRILITLCLISTLPLAACGSSTAEAAKEAAASSSSSSSTTEATPQPEALAKTAIANAQKASSAHVVAEMTQNGMPMKVDLAGTLDGSNQKANIDAGTMGKMELMTVGGKSWLRVNDAATAKSLGMPESVAGKYFTMKPEEMQGLGDLTLKSLLKEFSSADTKASSTTKVEETTEAGVKAWKITDLGNEKSTMIVSADSEQMLKISAAKQGSMTFSEWNAVKPFSAPPADQIINL